MDKILKTAKQVIMKFEEDGLTDIEQSSVLGVARTLCNFNSAQATLRNLGLEDSPNLSFPVSDSQESD